MISGRTQFDPFANNTRMTVAQRSGIPYWNVNVATSSNFPILEGYITSIRDHVKQAGEDPNPQKVGSPMSVDPVAVPQQAGTPESDVVMNEEDPDDFAARQGEQENTGGKSFNFKVGIIGILNSQWK